MSKKRYPVRIPRYAKGIRAQELRTGAGRSWWEKRWLATLEQKNINGRLGRGRNYALSGQVVAMRLEGPHVEAKVLGTREEAYCVAVDFRVPEGEARKRIVAALKAEPMLVARMLADDLPTEVEEIFKREGYDLFPGGRLKVEDEMEERGGGGQRNLSVLHSSLITHHSSLKDSQSRLYDMTTKCSCPDYANPCKHSDAVLLILGEEISRRPMTLVELRGIRMEELC